MRHRLESVMNKNQILGLAWIGKETRPKLELNQCDTNGLLGDAGDKNK